MMRKFSICFGMLCLFWVLCAGIAMAQDEAVEPPKAGDAQTEAVVERPKDLSQMDAVQSYRHFVMLLRSCVEGLAWQGLCLFGWGWQRGAPGLGVIRGRQEGEPQPPAQPQAWPQ